MADRPGLDGDADLENLISIWRQGSADLDRRLAEVYATIRAELNGPSNRVRLRRLRLQADRLADLQDVAEALADDLAQGTEAFIQSGGMRRIYQAGGERVAAFSFTAPHRAAVGVLAADLYGDVLTATRFVDADGKRFVRRVGRHLTGTKLTGGVPVTAQGRDLARVLAREFGSRGIGAIRYRDGSRHSFGEYAEMLLRTKTGVAYNAGTVNACRLSGIEFVELLDGSVCGLASHKGSPRANGLIVRTQVAADWPLSHPNCRRAVVPRPELNESNAGEAVSVQSPERRADQAAFEDALRVQAERVNGRRARRRRARRPRR